MKRSSPHASEVLGLWRRLGLGFVGFLWVGWSNRKGHPRIKSEDMLFLPTSRIPQNHRCPSPFREYDVDSHPRPAIRPLWAFPAATRMEPGSVSPEARMHPRLWRHRAGRMHEIEGAGIKFFAQHFHLHPRHPRARPGDPQRCCCAAQKWRPLAPHGSSTPSPAARRSRSPGQARG
ncbi:hypothetical protein SAMN05428936_101728 [Pelagibacterium halotolerans]|nr:hypothetical protein SAMN05428936_101728 [Pelagibacterium halotolerans]